MRSAEEIRSDLHHLSLLYHAAKPRPGICGAVTGMLNHVCKTDERRHKLLLYLFGKPSSKLLTGGEWYALILWTGVSNVGGAWAVASTLQTEVEAILDTKYYTFD